MTLVPKPVQPVPKIEEVDAIQNGMSRVLKQIWPAVEAGEFGVIVGDDTSGRIPALILSKVVNTWNREHGRPRIPVVFVPGTNKEEYRDALQQAFDKRRHLLRNVDRSSRALIVTEGITSGHSIASIGNLLQEEGFSWDVAALDGSGFTPRTVSHDTKRIEKARSDWEQEQEQLRNSLAELEKSREVQTRNDALAKAQLEKQLSTLQLELAATREALVREASELKAAEPFTGLFRKSKERDRENRIEELQAAAGGTARDPRIAHIQEQMAEIDEAKEVHRLESAAANIKKKIGLVPDFSAVLADDSRGVWPDDTRLFAGEQNAGVIRDREDLSGISQDKFQDHPAVRGTAMKTIRGVRLRINASVQDYLDPFVFKVQTVRKILPVVRKMLDTMRNDIELDAYGAIFGDDTSGRLPTLMVAHAINAYRRQRGITPLPVRFIEGLTYLQNSAQIEAFWKFQPLLEQIPKSKRILVVTDNVHSGKSAGSIAWRLYNHGFMSDIATLSEIDKASNLLSNGIWPPKTRGIAGNSNGAAKLVIDNVHASGLAQRSPKFSPGLVNMDPEVRAGMIAHRHDVRTATELLVRHLRHHPLVVAEIEELQPGLEKLAAGLQDSISHGAYSAIIAEDPHARVPALALGKAVNAARSKKGLPRLPIYFIPSPTSDSEKDAVLADVSSLESQYGGMLDLLKGSRAVMLSGALHSGKSTGALATWLDGHDIAVDIAPPRDPDATHEEYVSQGVLPASSRILTEQGINPWDLSKEPLLLQNHPEVTGVEMGDQGVVRAGDKVNPKEIQIARKALQNLAEGIARQL